MIWGTNNNWGTNANANNHNWGNNANANNNWVIYANINNPQQNFPNSTNKPEKDDSDKFIIRVKDKKYTCNKLAVNSSEVIREFREKNPNINEYVYNFDGQVDYFSVICDFFNFKKIKISMKNMKSLKDISENLKIDMILSQINEYSDKYDDIIQKVDPVEDSFDLLYHIQNLTVETVKNSLIESSWLHSESNIKELAALIFQVVRSGFEFHPFLIDLIVALDESSKNTEYLGVLKPFIVKKTLNFFYENKYYCCFANKLALRGIISTEQIIKKIVSCDPLFMDDKNAKSSWNSNNNENNNQNNLFKKNCHKNIVTWFLPELHENDLLKDKWTNFFDSKEKETFNYFMNGKIDIYKKMRDSCEPSNEILRALFNDDDDSLMTIISKNNINVNFQIDSELFDSYEANQKRSLLDFSAQYGAANCFKRLLANHAKCGNFTMGYAIFGGNTEIIRTTEQQISQDNLNVKFYNKDVYQSENKNNNNVWGYVQHYNQNYSSEYSNLSSPINIAIIMHKNDIFDWIIDNKIDKKEVNNTYLFNLAKVSVKSGNFHTFLYCIENGLSIQNHLDFINKSAEKGYFKFIELIFSISGTNFSKNKLESIEKASVIFGNISISKLIFNSFRINYQLVLLIAIQNNYEDIVQYIFDNLYQPQIRDEIYQILRQSISNCSSAVFNIIISKYNFEDLKNKFHFQKDEFVSLCTYSCSMGNLEISCKLIDFICEKFDFLNSTDLFIASCTSGSFEICSYLIDKKEFVDITKIISIYRRIFIINSIIALKLLDKFDPDTKESLSKLLFNDSIIEKSNKTVFEMFLPNNFDNNMILFGAVNFRDINLVNKVLEYNSQPSFINQRFPDGTALCIAVKNEDVEIVKRLLSIPGIDTSLGDENGLTPLILAIKQLNIVLLSLFIDYFEYNIQAQFFQLQQSLFILKESYFGKDVIISQEIAHKIVFVINGLSQICPSLSFENVDFLSFACEHNLINVVSELLNIKNINVNVQNNSTGDTPLIIAITKKSNDMAHLLINFPKIDINIARYDTHTALSLAASNNMEETVFELINHPSFDPSKSNIDLAFFISKNDQISKLLYSIKGLNVNYQISSSLLPKPRVQNTNRTWGSNNNNGGSSWGSYNNNGGNAWGNNNNNNNGGNAWGNNYNDNNNGAHAAWGRYQNESSFNLLETSLTYAASEKQLYKIELILLHSSFDPSKSRIKDALINSMSFDGDIVFNLLFGAIKDANVILTSGKSIFDLLVDKKRRTILMKIMNESLVNLSKEDLLKYYHNFMIDGHKELLDCLIEYDKRNNHYIDTNDISAMKELVQILK